MNDNVKQPLPPKMTKRGVCLRQPHARQRLWSAMRVLKRFDKPTLEIAASTSKESAQSYIGYLVNAGYLRIVHVANTRRGEHTVYALACRSGPIAPRITHGPDASGVRRRVVIDPNDGSRHPGSPGIDVCVG